GRISNPGRAAGVEDVEWRVDDLPRRHRPGGPVDAVEEIAMGEQAPRRERNRSAAGRARLERQGRDDPVHLAKVQMPAGQSVLLRRQPGEKGGDRAGGGGREDRGESPNQVAMQHATRAAPHQMVVPQTVDHQQNERASRAQRRHVEVR
ncbi:hypothetical protein RZS08_13660, partial [Arthrospira platensis SPKY1]|nr:hypothetical protein [Arthrospira platensis SPKY1]